MNATRFPVLSHTVKNTLAVLIFRLLQNQPLILEIEQTQKKKNTRDRVFDLFKSFLTPKIVETKIDCKNSIFTNRLKNK